MVSRAQLCDEARAYLDTRPSFVARFCFALVFGGFCAFQVLMYFWPVRDVATTGVSPGGELRFIVFSTDAAAFRPFETIVSVQDVSDTRPSTAAKIFYCQGQGRDITLFNHGVIAIAPVWLDAKHLHVRYDERANAWRAGSPFHGVRVTWEPMPLEALERVTKLDPWDMHRHPQKARSSINAPEDTYDQD